jgi:O-antigen ligase
MADDSRDLDADGAGDRPLALALLLPALVLAWPGPGSLLKDDFLPQATGAGAAALAALPAAIVLALRRRAVVVRSLPLFLFPLLVAAGWFAFGRLDDAFEARRALVRSLTSLALLLGGASLGPSGLATFARGILVVALLLLGPALADRADAFAGALGNTGSIAQAALPGAVAAAALLPGLRAAWKVAAALAVVLFLGYAAVVPVLAGGVALASGLGALALLGRDLSIRARGLLLGAALAAVGGALAPLAIQRAPAGPAPVLASGAGGGFQARERIWSRSLAMLADHAVLGVGPGQFAARFPPYRDPEEIELSTHGRALGAETEVEHPHEDWLAPALELGAPAGIAWVLFLLAVAAAAVRALRAAEPAGRAAAAGALALLVYALVHAPLTQEPAAGSIALVLFGAVLGARGAGPAAKGARSLALAAPFLLAASAPAALAFVRHGRALAALAAPEARDAALAGRAVGEALAACPDSAVAWTLRARLDEERAADIREVREDWQRVLERRPARVEALMQLAFADVRSGDFAAARAGYERARALDPGHPGIRRNLRVLDLQEGRLDDGSSWLEGARPDPETSFARSRKERAGGDAILADLLEARAHLLWARGHAAAGRFADAVRSYRQCVRVTGNHFDGGSPRVRLELAAALGAAGRAEEGRAELASIRGAAALDRSSLPAWAGEALRGLEAGN